MTGVFDLAGAERIRAAPNGSNEARLGMPLLSGADIIRGFWTVFPVPLAEAAGFDPAFAAEGIHWALAPGADFQAASNMGVESVTLSDPAVVVATR